VDSAVSNLPPTKQIVQRPNKRCVLVVGVKVLENLINLGNKL